MVQPNRFSFFSSSSLGYLYHRAPPRRSLSLSVLVFSYPGLIGKANAHLCGTGNTYNSASFNPAPGVYADITAIACGVGSGTFTSTHHQVECSTSSPSTDWSFGTGSYEYYGYKSNRLLAYDHLTSTSNTCPNNSQDFGSTGAINAFTDFSLTVTYIPTGASTTLSASASDCAQSSCPT